MSNLLQDSMSEATRLTKEGRLAEATAAIQRALGGISNPVTPEDTGETEGPVGTASRDMEVAEQPSENANFGRIEEALRGTLRPSRQYRSVPHLPDGLPSLPNGLTNGLPGLLEGLSTNLPDVLPGLHDGLAKVYDSTGHADWAATERKAEGELSKTSCPTQSAECLYRRGDYLAVTKLHSAPTPEALFWATKAYSRLAIQAFDQLGKFPDSVEIHAVKADILHGHGQDAEAAAEWRAALALSPGDPQLQRELARSLFLAHRYEEVMPMLNQMLASGGSAPDLNFMLGESLWRTQQPEKAVPYLTAALKDDPDLLPAHAALGMVDALLNKPAEAVPHLEKALSLDDDGSLHYSLARAYQAAGNSAQAQKTMQQYQQIKQRNSEINDQVAKEAEITAPASR